MGPAEDVDRVELDQTRSVYDLAEVADVDSPVRSSFDESLCTKGISSRLIVADPPHVERR